MLAKDGTKKYKEIVLNCLFIFMSTIHLYSVIKKEVYGHSYRSVGTQSEQSVNKPVCKILYHILIVFIRLNTNIVPVKKAADTTVMASAAHR